MLTPLEQAVIELLLDKDGEPFVTIRQQLAHATIAKREFSGVGFFTHFTLSADAPVKRNLPDMVVSHVSAKIRGLEHGAGFLLFIRDGNISMLEGHTYADDVWPTEVKEFQVFKQPT